MNLHNDTFKRDIKYYTIGFLLSIVATVIPFMIVQGKMATNVVIIWCVLLFATLQLIIQLGFFMHTFEEKGPKWNLSSFIFAAIIVLIFSLGSIWVMNNLYYHMMPTIGK